MSSSWNNQTTRSGLKSPPKIQKPKIGPCPRLGFGAAAWARGSSFAASPPAWLNPGPGGRQLSLTAFSLSAHAHPPRAAAGCFARGQRAAARPAGAAAARCADAVPTLNTDWWNYGGLTRDAYVAETLGTYIQDYQVQLAKDSPTTLAGYVQLSGGGRAGQTMPLRIAEAGLRQIMGTDTAGRATFRLPVKKLGLWSPLSPRLYAVTLSSGPDAVQDRIGFRPIQTRGQDILLGRPTFLRGLSMHDENPLIPGRARGEAYRRPWAGRAAASKKAPAECRVARTAAATSSPPRGLGRAGRH